VVYGWKGGIFPSLCSRTALALDWPERGQTRFSFVTKAALRAGFDSETELLPPLITCPDYTLGPRCLRVSISRCFKAQLSRWSAGRASETRTASIKRKTCAYNGDLHGFDMLDIYVRDLAALGMRV
jgi:hypothetical protein